jgi:DNA-binding MarR family transcriptional regulator
MGRAVEDELRPIGVTMVQAAILWVAKTSEKPVTPPMLSRLLVREPHTVQAILSRMERQGLIERTKDLQRKNLVRVTLTEKGEEAFARADELKTVPNLLSCLSLEERDALREYVGRLGNNAIAQHHQAPRWLFP